VGFSASPAATRVCVGAAGEDDPEPGRFLHNFGFAVSEGWGAAIDDAGGNEDVVESEGAGEPSPFATSVARAGPGN